MNYNFLFLFYNDLCFQPREIPAAVGQVLKYRMEVGEGTDGWQWRWFVAC